MEERALTIPSELGSVTIAPEAIAQIVGRTASECYGVVGMSLRAPGPPRDRVTRLLPKGKPLRGIVVRNEDGAVALELYVVVAYGLNHVAGAGFAFGADHRGPFADPAQGFAQGAAAAAPKQVASR